MSPVAKNNGELEMGHTNSDQGLGIPSTLEWEMCSLGFLLQGFV